MKIIGYGEDALTMYALSSRLGEVLAELGDESAPDECIVFYRPSFGRRSGGALMPGETASRSEFGEFDAVLGTPAGVYLIEAKWGRSSEIVAGSLLLRPEQIRRHHLLKAYLIAWRQRSESGDWSAFHAKLGGYLEVGGVQYPVAPPNSRLASSLERVLSSIAPCGEHVEDVVLYLRGKDDPPEPSGDGTFRFVTIDCPIDAGFIEIAP